MPPSNRPTADWPTFGTLRYGSHYWEGSLDLPAFGGPFPLILRATSDGPTPSQTAALARVLAEAANIRAAASAEMVAVHEESGLLPADLGSAPDAIWQNLLPCQIEVSDAAYYGDGRIAVLIIFESTQHGDFAPAIETVDGEYVGVLSGT
ncbi:hypothetical protein GRI97_04840 [Altererythrobacter xixiisoli]|uniref:Uncharacterized protein n=1 Tax=Croceibacterium xixiisoli TaxID=1476466 RepID=A0A6I4TSL2_9SPHN|nr:hypothetical protein [Croceibacterium xixiisoli]MXO98309.1 hypothetical protein [Croceibacterium xixiisoli]